MNKSSKHFEELQKLISEISNELQETSYLTGISTLSPRLVQAFEEVPRHAFIATPLQNQAYEDRPLSIRYGQTISQPFNVALMTELLDVKKTDIILKIGTGSGWQAAILSKLCRHVFTIEIIPELAKSAESTFNSLGYTNVQIRIGTGWEGWPENAPYDRIIITAAAETVPTALLTQLKPGGKMIIPLGKQGESQTLTLIIKDKMRNFLHQPILPVAFVPFVNNK